MLRYRIHYTLKDGSEDSVVLEGETLEELRLKALDAVESRGASLESAWSEKLEDLGSYRCGRCGDSYQDPAEAEGCEDPDCPMMAAEANLQFESSQ